MLNTSRDREAGWDLPLATDGEPEDVLVRRSEGSFIFDSWGTKYIDFLMGWCVGKFGWGNQIVKASIRRNRAPDYVYPMYRYGAWGELAELLARMTPGKLKTSFRATGGSEAVDIALQIAMASTRRTKFVSIEGSYHGNTIGAASVGASESRSPFGNRLPGCYKIGPPLDSTAAGKVERRLKKRDVAAFIMEPIICILGVLVPEKEFMTTVARLCWQYGTLLIMKSLLDSAEPAGCSDRSISVLSPISFGWQKRSLPGAHRSGRPL